MEYVWVSKYTLVISFGSHTLNSPAVGLRASAPCGLLFASKLVKKCATVWSNFQYQLANYVKREYSTPFISYRHGIIPRWQHSVYATRDMIYTNTMGMFMSLLRFWRLGTKRSDGNTLNQAYRTCLSPRQSWFCTHILGNTLMECDLSVGRNSRDSA